MASQRRTTLLPLGCGRASLNREIKSNVCCFMNDIVVFFLSMYPRHFPIPFPLKVKCTAGPGTIQVGNGYMLPIEQPRQVYPANQKFGTEQTGRSSPCRGALREHYEGTRK